MRINRIALCAVMAVLMATSGFGTHAAWAEASQTAIVFAENEVQCEGAGVTVEGTTATIAAAGTYRVAGECSQGQLVVNTNGSVTLLLDGIALTSADGPAIDIQDAGEVTLHLAAGTHSTLSDTDNYASAVDGQDAAVFSRADLVIGGEGTLTVNGQHNDGIASRDTLLITGGSIVVNAKNHGIKGKDYLLIQGGTVDVTAGGDGLKATNADQANLGYVQIDGGVIRITAQDDGISAVSSITINNGEIEIDTANNGMKSEGTLTVVAGSILITTGDDGLVSQTESISQQADVTIQERGK